MVNIMDDADPLDPDKDPQHCIEPTSVLEMR